MELKDREILSLRSLVGHLVEEQTRSNGKIIGVQVLTDQLDQKNEECRILKSKLKQLEVLLSRAENRMAQLTQHLNDKGSSSSITSGIVTPGVSKKLLEAITRENTKLKMALEHVLNNVPKGVDLAVENCDLHDLVLALKEELEQNRKETEELRSALKAVETDDSMALQDQIAQLTAQLTQNERSLKAKQVFCESVINENDRLKSTLETVKSGQVTQLATLRKLANDHPEIKDVLELTWSEDDVDAGHSKELEKLTKEVSLKQREMDHLKEINARINQEKVQISDLLTREIEDSKSENTILKEDIDRLKNDLQEVNTMKELLQGQCQDFENDFKMERQEKAKLETELKRERKQTQDLTKALNAVKDENQQIKHLIQKEYEKKQQQTSPTTTTSPLRHDARQWNLPRTGYKPPHFNPMRNQEVCADGARGSGQLRSDGPSGARGSGQPGISYLECPVCKMILPPHEIEGHLNDCDGNRRSSIYLPKVAVSQRYPLRCRSIHDQLSAPCNELFTTTIQYSQ